MVGQDLEDALGVITDDEEDRRGADRKVILVQDEGGRSRGCTSLAEGSLVRCPSALLPFCGGGVWLGKQEALAYFCLMVSPPFGKNYIRILCVRVSCRLAGIKHG